MVYKWFNINKQRFRYVLNDYKETLKKKCFIRNDGENLNIKFFCFRTHFRYSPKKTLMIFRFDGTGDYVLMRNFLPYIKNSQKYKDYKIILVGRDNFEPVVNKWDINILDGFVSVHYDNFATNEEYRKSIIKKLNKFKPNVILSPVYYWENVILLPLLKACKAEEKIGWSAQKQFYVQEDNSSYTSALTKVLEADEHKTFEFNRYKDFFEQVLEEPIDINAPSFNLDDKITKSSFILCNPFCFVEERCWDIEKWSEYIDWLIKKYNLLVLFIGSIHESAKIGSIIEKMKSKHMVRNMTGKMRLHDLPYFCKKAKLVVSVDTSTFHISMAVNTKTILLSSGYSYKAFHPYENRDNALHIYPKDFVFIDRPEIDNIEDFKGLINEISVKDVCNKTQEFLK